MSAIVGAFSASKDIASFNPEVEKEGQKKNQSHAGSSAGEASQLFPHCNEAEKNENIDGHDDDESDEEEEDDGILKSEKELDLGPQFSLKEQLEKDKDDESLRRWKEQLLGSVDFSAVGENKEPEVQILSLSILCLGRPDLVLPIPFLPNSKRSLFTLKEGCRYRLKFSFAVYNNIVSGFKYTNTVWKTGFRVHNAKVMLGTFSPQQEPYTFELEEETTPSGMFARGPYSARTKFVDDDGKCYLDMSYYFEIQRNWPPIS